MRGTIIKDQPPHCLGAFLCLLLLLVAVQQPGWAVQQPPPELLLLPAKWSVSRRCRTGRKQCDNESKIVSRETGLGGIHMTSREAKARAAPAGDSHPIGAAIHGQQQEASITIVMLPHQWVLPQTAGQIGRVKPLVRTQTAGQIMARVKEGPRRHHHHRLLQTSGTMIIACLRKRFGEDGGEKMQRSEQAFVESQRLLSN
mmetsp:Transcript_52406/g.97012  ORF Transcript_52406/g.97012 Transcript_52406/m.97012 type:complete len:200 (+) Transcript_52406:1133-1732(+)